MRFVNSLLTIFLLSIFCICSCSVLAMASGHEAVATAVEAGHKDIHAAEESHEHAKAGHGGHGGHNNLEEVLHLWRCTPFACILFSIALIPLLAP